MSLRGLLAGRAVAHVERHRVRRVSGIGDLAPHRLRRRAVDVDDDYLGALSRVAQRDRAPDPRPAAGDRRAVSFEQSHLPDLPLNSRRYAGR